MIEEIVKQKKKALVELVKHINETLEALEPLKKTSVSKQYYEKATQLRDLQIKIVSFRDEINDEYLQPNSVKQKQKQLNYQQVADHIFASGSLWKHRTLRTLFDPFASEYDHTTREEKIEILKKLLETNFPFEQLVSEYKAFYIELKKPNVARVFEQGLEKLLQKNSATRHGFPFENHVD